MKNYDFCVDCDGDDDDNGDDDQYDDSGDTVALWCQLA